MNLWMLVILNCEWNIENDKEYVKITNLFFTYQI